MAESTCANKVVGRLIKFIPLLNILATNPTVSPTIPPPTAITKSERLKFPCNNEYVHRTTLVQF